MPLGEKHPERLKVLELLDEQHRKRWRQVQTEGRLHEAQKLGADMAKLTIAANILRDLDWL